MTSADLETFYSAQDITDVDAVDAAWVTQAAAGAQFAVHQFKNFVGTEIQGSVTWTGQTDDVTNAIILQIWNEQGGVWETIDQVPGLYNGAAHESYQGQDLAFLTSQLFYGNPPVNTDIVLSGHIPDLTAYKDPSNVITCRVYQEAP